jgi:hypothetical protein
MKKLLALLVFTIFSSLQAEEQITFANIKSRIEDIPQVAWTNTHHLIKSNRDSSSSLPELEILVGPNTKLYFEDNKRAFVDAMTLWANVKRPTKYFAFFLQLRGQILGRTRIQKVSLLQTWNGNIDRRALCW